jgi:hypothetical protein
MLLRNWLLVVALIAFTLASTPHVALAQNGRCPAVTKGTQSDLGWAAEVFQSPNRSETRKYLQIERVPETGMKLQVVDDSVCQILHRAMVRALLEEVKPCADSACRTTKHLKPWQAERVLAIEKLPYYRVGDYYAVLWVLPRGNEYASLFIFRVPASQGGRNDLVGRILQFLGLRDSRELEFLGETMI